MQTKSRQFTNIAIAVLLLMLVSLICYAGVDVKHKTIALTFDDGPNPPYTDQILETLQQNKAKATFFVMGLSVKANPEVMKKAFAQGNEIGNHTYSHPLITKLSASALEKELTKTNQLIFDTIHVYPVLFRPPYGMSSGNSNNTLSRLGYKKITWDFMVKDYVSSTSTETIASDVIKHAHTGAIITMHDREKTAKALPTIIATLKKQGYDFVTVSELLNIASYRPNTAP